MKIKNVFFELTEETVNGVPKKEDLVGFEMSNGDIWDPISKVKVFGKEDIKEVTMHSPRGSEEGYIVTVVDVITTDQKKHPMATVPSELLLEFAKTNKVAQALVRDLGL